MVLETTTLPLSYTPINRRQRDQQATADTIHTFNIFCYNPPYPQCLIVLWVHSWLFSKAFIIFILLADMAPRGLHALLELHCMKTLTYDCIS